MVWLRLVLVCVCVCVCVHLINGSVVELTRVKRGEIRQTDESSRIPSDIRIRAGEHSFEVHWTPPLDINTADQCTIEYKDSPSWGTPVSEVHSAVQVEHTQTSHFISGLLASTRYELRLYCSYGNTRGSSTDWIYASTRTVSVENNICSGSIPHAFLDKSCVDYPRYWTCKYACEDGYRINEFAAVLNNNPLWGDDILIFCRNGTWITNFEDEGLKIEDICLPEAIFEKCPASIPNGKLQKHCGPATDWLCEFKCNSGYRQNVFMGDRLKGFNNRPAKLLCGNDGVWKTGYEHVGLDISELCFPRGFDHNCTADIPHATVYKPCPSGYTCASTCDDGYRLRALAEDDGMTCVAGEWALRATKLDQSIIPQTVCVPDASQSSCPREIPNGRIPDGCTVNCEPICNNGYDVIGNHELSMAPVTVTCDNGQWLTKSEPYTGENICFPEGGMLCPPEIPNGGFSDNPERLKDYGRNREYMPYRCHDGYRNNRGVRFIECVAGKWVTWNERFGIDTSDLCIPINQNKRG